MTINWPVVVDLLVMGVILATLVYQAHQIDILKMEVAVLKVVATFDPPS